MSSALGPMATVIRNVRRLRESRGWTQAELAAHLRAAGWSIGRAGAAKVEVGARRVNVDELAVLGSVFGVDPWSLTSAPACDACLGVPPAGFSCLACGTSAPAVEGHTGVVGHGQ